jgi:ferredoxin
VVIAGGAFLGEHSYSIPEYPIAAGRPDAADLLKAEEFGREIMELFRSISEPGDITLPELPGNRPYREKAKHPKAPPETDPVRCNLCGECIEVCPVGAVSIEGQVKRMLHRVFSAAPALRSARNSPRDEGPGHEKDNGAGTQPYRTEKRTGDIHRRHFCTGHTIKST